MNVEKNRVIKQRCYAPLLGLAGLLVVLNIHQTHASPLQGYVMRIQMAPAICALDRNSAKQRKCLEGYSLTIAGLIPETNTANCTTQSSAVLSPLQAKVMIRVIPEENVRYQLWRDVGGCIPMNASQYFRMMINLAEKLKMPSALNVYEDRKIQQSSLKAQFLKLNQGMSSNGIKFSCQNIRNRSVLTEIRVCYKANGEFQQCSSKIVTNCPHEFDIKGSY